MKLALTAAAVALGLVACQGPAEGAARLPAPIDMRPPSASAGPQTIVLAGGCFWGLQGVFAHVRGIIRVVAGYDGGSTRMARYEAVSTGLTGNAESVKITFDPARIALGEILRIYFSVATDPTQVNRQFPDIGPQYRGEIFYENLAQKRLAQRYIAQLAAAHVFSRPIATRVDPDSGFVAAEAYHQNYLVRHPDAPYIATYDQPKVADLKRLFPEDWRPAALIA